MLRASAFAVAAIIGLTPVAPNEARAQGYSPGANGSGGSTSYIPYGGNMSGFIPYSGPAGGLGVQPGMSPMGSRTGAPSVMFGGMAPSLGAIRSRLTPLAPLGTSAGPMGLSGGLGLMGAGSSMIRRTPAGSGMGGGMSRPPVGGYPFSQPPSLVSPAAPAAGMSM